MTATQPPSPADPSVLVVIPARGGSKGIPRKNLRTLAGRPLIRYAIETALASRFCPLVVVSTDDDEIALVAERCGAQVHRREPSLGQDAVTLDPVIHETAQAMAARHGRPFDLVVTQQPTSPLLRTASLDQALQRLVDDPGIDTLISAKDATHLSWRLQDGAYLPNYQARLNRQYLPKVFSETGGFLIARWAQVTPTSRIGPSVSLHVLEPPESIDIDGHDDWGLCTYYLRRRRVLFVVSGYREIGLGHVFHTLLLANDMMDHEVGFLVDARSRLAYDVIAARHYPVAMQGDAPLADEVARLRPDVVVNDRLDTELDYMQRLKALGIRTVNVEDLGPGAPLADAVVNAIYPATERGERQRVHEGPAYASLRDEFLLTEPRPPRARVERVLVLFGGTDPSGLTEKVLEAVEPWCAAHGIALDVVTGPGYPDDDRLDRFRHARVHRGVSQISRFMRDADLAFTSAGRTIFELAAMGTPAIVLAQNPRELTHTFAAEAHGFLHLGLGRDVAPHAVLRALQDLVADDARRLAMRGRMLETDVRDGRQNVVRIIDEVVRSL